MLVDEQVVKLDDPDFYDNMKSPGPLGWVPNDYVPHSPFVSKRADKLASEMADIHSVECAAMSNRDFLRRLGVDGAVPFGVAAVNAGLVVIGAGIATSAVNENEFQKQRAA